MATRSIIGYETADGGYVGVYCQYDGYPKHMGPCLDRMFHADVVIMVNEALHRGGIRSIGYKGGYDTFDDGSIAAIIKWPNCDQEFSYRKRLDGRVEWTRDGININEWSDDND